VPDFKESLNDYRAVDNSAIKDKLGELMSTEKFFKILKKVQDFSSLVHTIFFTSASGMKLKSQKKHKKMRSIK
jgi:tRNA G37 N-methylase TrmD